MHDRRNETRESKARPILESGPGALCPEAQADGVPCEEIGVDCAECEMARPIEDETGVQARAT